MITATLQGLLGRKLRTALTALSIVLGVAMVSGTFVLTNTMKKAFDDLFAGTGRAGYHRWGAAGRASAWNSAETPRRPARSIRGRMRVVGRRSPYLPTLQTHFSASGSTLQ